MTTQTTLSLGKRLAQAQQAEQASTQAAEAARAARKSAKALADYNAVKAFFALAITEAGRQIDKGRTKVEVEIGHRANGKAHTEVETLLRCGNYTTPLEKVLVERKGARTQHPYLQLFRDFQAWALSQDLVATFEYRHDGVGVHSWHALVLKPV